MKAIVANLLWGSIFYCLSSNFSVLANSTVQENRQPRESLAAKTLRSDHQLFLTKFKQAPSFYGGVPWIPYLNIDAQEVIYFAAPTNQDYLKQIIELDAWYLNQDINTINLVRDQFLPEGRKSQIHQGERGEFVLGFHDTFWNSDNKDKYWGLTTVEQWGEEEVAELELKKLDYATTAPKLPEGTTTLTVSGGGKRNLLPKNDILNEFEDFRGGIAYHEGLADNVTLGLGFVYEDFLSGFSQLTYQPDNFPLRTSISLRTKEAGVDFNSHLQLKPSQSFVLNFYNNSETQKFDLNWDVVSGFTLIANGNTQQESLSAGARIAFKNELMSFLAKAELDSDNEVQWQIRSQFGSLQLIHVTNSDKSKSEIQYDIIDYSGNFHWLIFFKHEIKEIKREQEELAIWGWNFNSGEEVAKNRYSWEFELGYGVGSQGEGAIASATKAINPDLFLKFTYENISLKSDDTEIKFELTSQ